jgi:hypothetical protein
MTADSSGNVVIALRPEHFGEKEAVLATYGGMTASTFRYSTGVAALRIVNRKGEIVLLPFQGQQIWDARFLGRTLTMKTYFPEPVPTSDYLSTYGAFFLHCGVTAMGNPGAGDTHPLHGELPNAVYREAELVVGTDKDGPFMAMTGLYRHRVSFAHNYTARPTVTLHADATAVDLTLDVHNLKLEPMEIMYLGHINFRPVDEGQLIDTFTKDRKRIRVRSAPADSSDEHKKFIDAVKADPDIHRHEKTGRRIKPELVLAVDCAADKQGWAHSMQLHPDGSADFVSHRPDELKVGVRWTARHGDMDALGLMLPATAEPDGYNAEKKKGNVGTIPPDGHFRFHVTFGALDPAGAKTFRKRIEAVKG